MILFCSVSLHWHWRNVGLLAGKSYCAAWFRAVLAMSVIVSYTLQLMFWPICVLSFLLEPWLLWCVVLRILLLKFSKKMPLLMAVMLYLWWWLADVPCSSKGHFPYMSSFFWIMPSALYLNWHFLVFPMKTPRFKNPPPPTIKLKNNIDKAILPIAICHHIKNFILQLLLKKLTTEPVKEVRLRKALIDIDKLKWLIRLN